MSEFTLEATKDKNVTPLTVQEEAASAAPKKKNKRGNRKNRPTTTKNADMILKDGKDHKLFAAMKLDNETESI